jgi:hypothetical protein
MVYSLLASGEIPSIRVGRSLRVSVDALQEWIKRRQERSNSSDLENQKKKVTRCRLCGNAGAYTDAA